MLTAFVISILFITCFQTRETAIFIFKYRLRTDRCWQIEDTDVDRLRTHVDRLRTQMLTDWGHMLTDWGHGCWQIEDTDVDRLRTQMLTDWGHTLTDWGHTLTDWGHRCWQIEDTCWQTEDTCWQTEDTDVDRLRTQMLTAFCLKEQEIGNKITPPTTHFQLVTIIVHHRTCFVEYETTTSRTAVGE